MFFAKASQAANYYVSTTGSDSYSGLYETYQGGSNGPWKTLGKANSTVTSGAHTINVAAGTYNEYITETHSGSEGNLIWWKANGTVIVPGFRIWGSWIKFTGFEITHSVANRKGIMIEHSGGADEGHCIIDSNYIHDIPARGILLWQTNNNTVSNNTIARVGGIGIRLDASYNLVENNDISDVRNRVGGVADEDGDTQADGIRNYDRNSPGLYGTNTFRGNYIHGITHANQYGYPFSPSKEPPHIDAFQGSFINSVIERNHVVMMEDAVHSNTSMHGLMIEGGSNLTIRNNIFEGHSFMNTGGGPNITGLYIYNNTIRSSLNFWDDPYTPYGFQLDYVAGAVEIKNNISVDFEVHYMKLSHAGGAAITQKNNCIFNSNGSTPGMSEISADPTDLWMQDALFVNEWSDLKLQGSSPCKDAGITIASVTDDYLGVSRPQGTAYDIGAYEYIQAGDTIPPAAPTGVRVD